MDARRRRRPGVAVYADLSYRRDRDVLSADQAFVRFLGALGDHVEPLTLIGRLDPRPGRWPHPVPGGVRFVALPHYESLAGVGVASRAAVRSLARLWRALDDVGVLWLVGPHPLALPAALMAAARRRRVVLGVRQDLPRYVRRRHPRRPLLWAAAIALEGGFRALACAMPVVAVGPDAARRYRHAPALLEVLVSLVPERLVFDGEGGAAGDRVVRVVSVGRLAPEKNPMLLADVAAGLEPDWRLTVCGDGPQAEPLAARLRALGVDGRVELRGHVAPEEGLLDLVRDSDALLHVSWTEGVPQVVLEAFSMGTPVIATAVGGVAQAVGPAALLVPPGDAGAAVAALQRLRAEPATRRRLAARGRALARAHALEQSACRVAAFLAPDELTVEPLAGFDEAAPAWARLSEHAGGVFRTLEWARTWWRHHGRGRQLQLAHLRHPDGTVVAVLPLYLAARRPVAVLRFLGHGEGDRLGPVCAPADRPAVARALGRTLAALGGRSAVLAGDHLPGEERWAALCGAVTVRHDGSPVVRLDGCSWEEYLAARSRNFREQALARPRRLRRRHDVGFRLADEATLGADLDALVALHDGRWEGQSGAFAGAWGAFHRDFAQVALARGWLRLWLLELDGRPAAAILGYRFADVECHYQSGRDPSLARASVGFVLLAHALRTAMQDGVREYQLLRGDERYKARFATDDPGLETIALGRGAGRAASLLARLPAHAQRRLAARMA